MPEAEVEVSASQICFISIGAENTYIAHIFRRALVDVLYTAWGLKDSLQ